LALRKTVTERQRRFGATLRELRERAGLSALEAAGMIAMRGPQLSHIEAGRTPLDSDRVRALMSAYGCRDAPLIDALIDLGAQTGRGWWSPYRETMPGHALDLAEMECSSRRIDAYETFYVPGLLQTPAYMQAIYEYRYDRIEKDSALAFRLERQRILSGPDGPDCRFVIHEAALHMKFAGRQNVRDQLIHLMEMAENPRISIQVLPFSVEGSSPYPSPFFICTPDVPALATVGIDHPNRVEYLTSPPEIENYQKTFNHLAEISSSPVKMDASPRNHSERNSWGLIQHILYQV
jgi:transcriptional regulator with XRE-family HTH domain